MQKISHNNFILFSLAILVMLFLGRLFGEILKKINFPMIVGEILAGIVLGPAFLGKVSPDLYQKLFNPSANLDIFIELSLVLVMFVCGVEINFVSLVQQKKPTLFITMFSIFIPFIIGILTAWLLNNLYLIENINYSMLTFYLFLGTAFAIGALPVIAKILIDHRLIDTNIGSIIIASAILTDIIGWSFFTFITGFTKKVTIFTSIFTIILFTLLVSIIVKLIGKLSNKIKSSPDKLSIGLSISICICLSFAIVFQFLSLPSCLGGMLSGIVLRRLVMENNQLHKILYQFIINFFAPIFFVSIGIKVNFIENFELGLIIIVFILASLSKVMSVFIGGYLAGIRGIDLLFISTTLNARGAMEIVFSTIALELGIIPQNIHIALIVLALLTSIISGVVAKSYIKQV